MDKNLKPLLIYVVASLCMIILPEIFSFSLVTLGQIITIAGYVLLIISSCLTILVFYKNMLARKTLEKAIASDPVWDEDQMKINARLVFYKVQHALESNDITSLKDFVTPAFESWLFLGGRHSTSGK
jgi:hypothetical protein